MRRKVMIYDVDRLSPGTKSVVLRFEKAVRDLAQHSTALHAHRLASATAESTVLLRYVRAKQALVRRLRRIEGTLTPDTRGRPPKVPT
jgi:hypothetical protein